jgi:hypothetical protein
MAEEIVDRAVGLFTLMTTGPCWTKEVQLVCSEGWAKNMFIGFIQRVRVAVHKEVVVDVVNRRPRNGSRAGPLR